MCHRFDVLALGMLRILEMEPRQRDSVAITMRKAITPWLRTSLVGEPDRHVRPAGHAVRAGAHRRHRRAATVTLLDSLVRRWRKTTAARAPMQRLLMIVDELPNTAPIPSLRRIVGEGRGPGHQRLVNMGVLRPADVAALLKVGRLRATEARIRWAPTHRKPAEPMIGWWQASHDRVKSGVIRPSSLRGRR